MSADEKVIWKGNPSQWVNFGTYFFCALLAFAFIAATYFAWQFIIGVIIPFLITVSAYWKVKTKFFEITTERLIITEGVMSKKMVQIEFYRIKDIVLTEPFLFRMAGLSNLTFVSSDRVEDIAPIVGIKDGERIREELRNAVETVRQKKQVYVRDV